MSLTALPPPDFHLACYCDVNSHGGALSFARGLAAALQRRGLTTTIVGVAGRGRTGRPTAVLPGRANAPRCRSGSDDSREHGHEQRAPAVRNVSLPPQRVLWRCGAWTTPRRLARAAAHLAAPRLGVVAVSPCWLLAARRAWPGVHTTFLFPCLLTNCLPFTWPQRRPPDLWTRISFAGIRAAERATLRTADTVLVPTRQALEEICALVSGVRGRASVCWFGTEILPEALAEPYLEAMPPQVGRALPANLEAAAHAIPRDAFVLLGVGVLDRNKAFDLAVRALPGTSTRVHLVLVGDGPERAELGHLAATLGVGDRVHLVGARSDISNWYAAADALVSTSYYDAFPNVVLEALGHGRPVLVPRHDPPRVYSGAAELITELGGGIVYDRTSEDSLAAAIDPLPASPDLVRQLGQQGRAAARAHLRWDACAAVLLNAMGLGSLTPGKAGPCSTNVTGDEGRRGSTAEARCTSGLARASTP